MANLKMRLIVPLLASLLVIIAFQNAVGGERFKLRTAEYYTTWQKTDIDDEKGHMLAVTGAKTLTTNMDGKAFGDGWAGHSVGSVELRLKTGTGSGQWYAEMTDEDGDKIYSISKGKRIKGAFWASYWEGETTYVRGTGKYQGIKGKGTWKAYPVAPNQSYSDAEIVVELP